MSKLNIVFPHKKTHDELVDSLRAVWEGDGLEDNTEQFIGLCSCEPKA